MDQLRLTRRRVLGGLAAAALAAPAVARSGVSVDSIGGPAFGTGWKVSLRPAGLSDALRNALQTTIARIDLLMSPWRDDSAVSRLNAGSGREWQAVDPELATVVRAALQVRDASGGAFDPCVGPAVGRWGFGPIAPAPIPPDAGVRISGDALRKSRPAATLDLCGIAKGHALDRMVAVLQAQGAEDFVLDLGGEIAACGRHPAGRAWQVAVEDPRDGREGAAEVVALEDRVIATSGDRINGYSRGGRRYSHIIDPATGEPVQGAAASVSVIAGTAMLADAWATALMSAGVRGPALARQNGLDALFLFREGSGLRRVAVGRFDGYLA